jgi:ketosteroid isomerase-like protein
MGQMADTYLPSLEAFNTGEKEAWLAVSDPELVNHPPREWPEAAVIHGNGAVWDFWTETFEMWDERPLIEVVGPIDESDDTIVAHLQARVRGKSSGAEILWEYFQAVTFRDGKAARIAWFSDRDEALEAAGIRSGGESA